MTDIPSPFCLLVTFAEHPDICVANVLRGWRDYHGGTLVRLVRPGSSAKSKLALPSLAYTGNGYLGVELATNSLHVGMHQGESNNVNAVHLPLAVTLRGVVPGTSTRLSGCGVPMGRSRNFAIKNPHRACS